MDGELAEKLRLHGMWARNEDGGARADLRGAGLRGDDAGIRASTVDDGD